MVDDLLWKICEQAAEVQALLHDHIECGNIRLSALGHVTDPAAQLQASGFVL
jgi:hypothetical protein